MTTKTDENTILYAVLSFAIAVPSIMWRGFVLAKLWAWFVVPLGLPVIGMWHAAGLAGLTAYVADSAALHNRQDDGKTPRERFLYAAGFAAVAPLLVWGAGALIHAMM